jgi:hypothetical protein
MKVRLEKPTVTVATIELDDSERKKLTKLINTVIWDSLDQEGSENETFFAKLYDALEGDFDERYDEAQLNNY